MLILSVWLTCSTGNEGDVLLVCPCQLTLCPAGLCPPLASAIQCRFRRRIEHLHVAAARMILLHLLFYASTFGCLTEKKIVELLLRPSVYSKHKLPHNGVLVKVEFWIQSITAVDEVTNDFEVEMYINELWLDPKLRFDHLSACRSNLSLDQAVLDRIWSPQSSFVNTKSAEILDSPFPNVFLTLFENGTVWVNYRIRVIGPCLMDLADFPMDSQSCRLNYQSFSYSNAEVRMRWNSRRAPVFTLSPLKLPEFSLIHIGPAVVHREFPAGMWDELVVNFVFERRYMWYLLQAYMPTYFTIFISWVSFALGPQAITPRTMIGVNALLSMIFHFGSIMRNLPRVSYVKAIDVWMLFSMLFVFLSMVELAVVGYNEARPNRSPTLGHRVDRVACFIFPAAFSIFNIVYWARYGCKFTTSTTHPIAQL